MTANVSQEFLNRIMQGAILLVDKDYFVSNLEKIIEEEDVKKRKIFSLAARYAFVLKKRFCLDCDEPMTLKAIGDVLGVTTERIRQCEARGLRYLRHPRLNGKIFLWDEPGAADA